MKVTGAYERFFIDFDEGIWQMILKQIEKTKEKGMTLIEIIAVLVIVSILATVVSVKYIDFDKNAEVVVNRYEIKSTERNDFHKDLLEKD